MIIFDNINRTERAKMFSINRWKYVYFFIFFYITLLVICLYNQTFITKVQIFPWILSKKQWLKETLFIQQLNWSFCQFVSWHSLHCLCFSLPLPGNNSYSFIYRFINLRISSSLPFQGINIIYRPKGQSKRRCRYETQASTEEQWFMLPLTSLSLKTPTWGSERGNVLRRVDGAQMDTLLSVE